MHTNIFWPNQLQGPKSKNTPLAVKTPSIQILISPLILQQKDPELLGEMAGSRTGAENT